MWPVMLRAYRIYGQHRRGVCARFGGCGPLTAFFCSLLPSLCIDRRSVVEVGLSVGAVR